LNQACKFIAKHEGLELKAYKCHAGIWTIGYGDTEYLKQFQDPKGQKITKEMAEFLLEERIKADYVYLLTLLQITLTINQIIALLSLMFNIGREAFSGSSLLRKMNQGTGKEEITAEFMKWKFITKNGKKEESKILAKRRKEEIELYFQIG
jgi:lysozyme